ncbi:LysR family transcriptional regulator [Bordetella sp. 02P26C-1]|uniref:LysR family transcriptional regulator n=1 Tax=Bordetella sp. 02P26C-1 TaxID=2683195 RepID=UPI00135243A4|nr:LysR family transcriptional regulator [Bordetella sp. 02P26C-1]MVW77805.1 LysR family transcriptional regulator [Bordetella sp. 02P26C-1]
MELRQLRYFVETAHRRSITKAASALHIVQPALTAQIKALEEELGTRLLERSARGVSLTESGEAVLRDATAILRAVDQLKRRHATTPCSGRAVKIGIPNGMTRTFAGQLLERARQEGRFEVELIEGMSGHLLEWLKSGRLDISVLFASQPLRQLHISKLTTDVIDLVGPSGALHDTQPVEFRDLGRYPLILPTAKHGLTRLIHAQARLAGVELQQHATLDSIAEIKHLVSQGVGYTLLAPMVYQPEKDQGLLSAAPLCNPTLTRDLVTATRRAHEDDDIAQARALVHDICGCRQGIAGIRS